MLFPQPSGIADPARIPLPHSSRGNRAPALQCAAWSEGALRSAAP